MPDSPTGADVPGAIREFFIECYGYSLPSRDAEDLAQRLLSRGLSSATLKLALSSDPEAVGLYVAQTHRLASQATTDWLLQIVTKGPVFDLMSGPEVERAWRDLRLSSERSKYFYAGFLGQAEFELGRQLADTDRDTADRVLVAAAGHLASSLSVAKERDLAGASRYQCGMLGVLSLFLRRSGGLPRIKAAIHYLERAEANGDESPQHYRYLGEAYLELSDYEPKRWIVETAVASLANARAFSRGDPEVDSLYAQAAYKFGAALVQDQDLTRADHFLQEAIEAYEALEKNPPRDYHEASLAGRHGGALLCSWWTRKDLSRVAKAARLLRTASRSASSWKHQLARALLILATHGAEEAGDSLSEALNVIESIPEAQVGVESLKLRARIRLAAAAQMDDLDLFAAALRDFEGLEASTDDPEISFYIGTLFGLRGLQTRSVEDLHEAEALLRESPMNDEKPKGPGLYPRISRELALAIADKEPARALTLLKASIDVLGEVPGSKDNPELLSMIGGSYFYRYRIGKADDDLHAARRYYENALGAGAAGVEFFGLLGDCTLQCSKIESDLHIREELLRAALEYLLQSGSFGKTEFSHFSKLGEAHLRLGRLIRDPELLAQSLAWLEDSRSRGNESAENFGLIGDAHYQLSRYGRKVFHLQEALAYKELSRARSDPSREHLSLVGRIHYLLYEERSDGANLRQSIEFICRAVAADRDWPWPVCQLAEMLDENSEAFALIVTALSGRGLNSLSELIQGLDTGPLWKEGAQLALASEETSPLVIGGKSNAWVVVDPLGLLESAFVFKPSLIQDAQRASTELNVEAERIENMAALIQRLGLEHVETARVIGVLETDGRYVLAMRRALGRPLSDLLIRGPTKATDEAIERAIHFLASYHGNVPPVSIETNWARLRNHIRYLSKTLTGRADTLLDALSPYEEQLQWLPVVAKRDAHGRNWLVLKDGRLVVLDFETPQPRFLLEELAQLLEDSPFLPTDKASVSYCYEWRTRYAKGYLETFNSYGGKQVTAEPALLNGAYVFFGVCQALQGLSIARAEHCQAVSSSGKHHWKRREQSNVDLVRFFEVASSSLETSFHPDYATIVAAIEGSSSPNHI